jgi:conjugative transfer region protein TrbK
MRRPPADFGVFGRALGLIAIAVVIVATAIYLRHDEELAREPLPAPSAPSDPLARELARCQGIGMAAQDDAGCIAVWAENRRRFFAVPPADASSVDPTTEHKATTRVEDR